MLEVARGSLPKCAQTFLRVSGAEAANSASLSPKFLLPAPVYIGMQERKRVLVAPPKTWLLPKSPPPFSMLHPYHTSPPRPGSHLCLPDCPALARNSGDRTP